MALRDRLSPNARPACRPGPVSAAPRSSLRAPRQRSPCRGVWGRPWAPHAGASPGHAGSSPPAELLSASSLGRHAPLGIPLHAACSACPLTARPGDIPPPRLVSVLAGRPLVPRLSYGVGWSREFPEPEAHAPKGAAKQTTSALGTMGTVPWLPGVSVACAALIGPSPLSSRKGVPRETQRKRASAASCRAGLDEAREGRERAPKCQAKILSEGGGKDLRRLRKVLSPHTSDLQNAGTERPCVFLVHHHVIRSSGFAEFLLHGDAMCWVSLAIALSSDVKYLRDSFASVRKESNLSKAFSSPDSPACLIHE